MASWPVQKCCAFRHSCNILEEELEVDSRQMPSVPVGSQLRKVILRERHVRKQPSILTGCWR
uniref:Uncharacterized protein n=1 Tax=Aotus nancymaae TaxID=37293 RepID=A0A2K5F183_AOTNA